MKNVKLVAADMDHTLLRENGELPEGFDKYMERLDKLGIYFVAASGRPMYTLEKMFEKSLDRICIISDNGAMIKVKGKRIYSDEIPVSEYQKMIHFSLEHEAGIPVLCAFDSGYVDARYKKYEKIMSRFFAKLTFVEDMENISPAANKYTVFFPDYDAKKYLSEMYAPNIGDAYSVTVGGEEWIDIMNHGINKGTAIKRLADYLGIDINDTMAFGDTYNDIEMLKTVNFSYVMENASMDMRKYGKFLAKSNEDRGVLLVMDELITAKTTDNSPF